MGFVLRKLLSAATVWVSLFMGLEAVNEERLAMAAVHFLIVLIFMEEVWIFSTPRK